MRPLTESRPSSGEGGSNCQVCTWQLVSEDTTTRTERCSRCGQVRNTKKPTLSETKQGKRLLTEG